MSDTNGFHKAHCDVCNRQTWHYRDKGATLTHCTDHSPWAQGRKRHLPDVMVQGGLGKPVPVAPNERELRIANKLDMSLWRHAEEHRKAHASIGKEDWAKDLFANAPGVKPKDPDKLYCTFCGDEVQEINRLTEKKALIRRVTDAYKDSSGEVIVQEKIVTKTETVNACPQCCLMVRKPIVVRRV